MLMWGLAASWSCFIRMLRGFVRSGERRVCPSDGIIPPAQCQLLQTCMYIHAATPGGTCQGLLASLADLRLRSLSFVG